MSKDQKMDIIRKVESSGLSLSHTLKKLDMPRSTYYRWKKKLRTMGVQGYTTYVAVSSPFKTV